jgi:multidrug efflux pump subunit AcrA (membrane-fusion protein)
MEIARYRSQMGAEIRGREANLVFFTKKKERTEHLSRKDLAAQADMEEAETNRLLSETQLKEAREKKELAALEYKRAVEVVNRRTIRSPVNGVVMARFLSAGEYVENEPILKIAEVDPLNVEVIIPSAQLNLIKRGMKATVLPEAPVGGRYTAVVKIVDRVVDAASGTYGVRLELPNAGRKIPAGIKAKVIFGSR